MSTYEIQGIIDDGLINSVLESAEQESSLQVQDIISKGATARGLSLQEVAVLLQNQDPDMDKLLFQAASDVKENIYGNRIVLFTPLYISDYCVNDCLYCGYKTNNSSSHRKRLTDDEIKREVQSILELGHKRIALETGEDPVNCPIDYIVHAMDTIYKTEHKNNKIRRINVNIAATDVADYKKLKQAGIGTYILFQETYHRETYEKIHPTGPKSDYDYHLTAMDRAMEAGIDDVGLGALFGLYDYKYEVLSLLLHSQHLERKYGVGPHTISVPRLKSAENVSIDEFPYLVSDYDFKRIVAILRLAVPYTGIILSTREAADFREQVMRLGVSQISAGSCTGVGEYYRSELEGEPASQFEIADDRKPNEVVESLCKQGYIPSYCTACYRTNRTGEEFMDYAKQGKIQQLCLPNAILTFKEYLQDFAHESLRKHGEESIRSNVAKISDEQLRQETKEKLQLIEQGYRDLYF